MRQIVLDNPPSASTSTLLEKIRREASSKYRKVKRAAKKAAQKIRKAAKRKRKAVAKKSKPNKGKNMAKSKNLKARGASVASPPNAVLAKSAALLAVVNAERGRAAKENAVSLLIASS